MEQQPLQGVHTGAVELEHAQAVHDSDWLWAAQGYRRREANGIARRNLLAATEMHSTRSIGTVAMMRQRQSRGRRWRNRNENLKPEKLTKIKAVDLNAWRQSRNSSFQFLFLRLFDLLALQLPMLNRNRQRGQVLC